MPEREYFSLRYAVPGYTLILFVILINYVPLIKILERTQAEAAFGAFLAFLSLFSGSALGFLISQIWYVWFKKTGGFFGIPCFESVKNVLFEECERRAPGIKIPDKYEDAATVFDFINHSKRNDELFELTQRRWDMYHTLSATYLALVTGISLGISCRIYHVSHTPIRFAEFLTLVFILICACVLLWVIFKGIRISMDEYRPLLEAIIRTSDFSAKTLRKAFPDYFPPQKQSKAHAS